MNSLISVIVPVYNVEKCLDRCIKSIVNQTYKNIEVILINDGSTDNSLKICKEWQSKDKRIVIVDQKNKGVSAARNIGLDIAKGEYVAFVDSDDWINEIMYETLLNLLKEHHTDIAECDFIKVESESCILNQPELKFHKLKNDEFIKNLFNGTSYSNILVWNKLYKRSLFTEFRFPEGVIHEDQFLLPKIYLKCNTTIHCNQKLYYYFENSNSITRSQFTKKRLDSLKSFEETRNLCIHNQRYDDVEWVDSTFAFILIKYYNLVINELNDRQIAKKIKDCYNSRLSCYIKNKHLNIKQKVLLIMYWLCPRIYKI